MPKNSSPEQPSKDGVLNPGATASPADLWLRENAEALAERRTWIAKNGTPLADIQVLRTS